MKKLVVLFLVLFLCTPAVAENWADKLEVGGDIRMRGYTMQNMWDFDYQDQFGDFDSWEMFRLRTRLRLKANVSEDVTGFVQIANQTYGEGVTKYRPSHFSIDGVKTSDYWEEDNYSNKVFVDNAYIDVKNIFALPASLRVGRQNLMYGSGFILFDGQSQYASTSIYFDGVKLSFNLGQNAVLDALYFKDQEEWQSNSNKDDITLTGAYLTAHCPFIGGQQEIYALNRDDRDFQYEGMAGRKNIWAFGLRLSDKLACGFDYSGEAAYQTGNYTGDFNNTDHEALGYKLEAGYALGDIPTKPRFFLGYSSFSGDEEDTDDYEGWDVFYGGWPQFGDLLAWMFVQIPPNAIVGNIPESTEGEAAYSNINIATAGFSNNFGKLSTKLSYSMLRLDEADEKDFGDYYQAQASYAYSKNLGFSVYAAMIEPGDHYKNKGMEDEAYEFFWEANLSF